MPGWGIIYDTAAGNGPHHDTLGISGFLPHGRTLMKPSQNVETGKSALDCLTPTCGICPFPTSTALLSTLFSRGSSCEESINSGDLPMIVRVMDTGLLVSQTETAIRNKIVKA